MDSESISGVANCLSKWGGEQLYTHGYYRGNVYYMGCGCPISIVLSSVPGSKPNKSSNYRVGLKTTFCNTW